MNVGRRMRKLIAILPALALALSASASGLCAVLCQAGVCCPPVQASATDCCETKQKSKTCCEISSSVHGEMAPAKAIQLQLDVTGIVPETPVAVLAEAPRDAPIPALSDSRAPPGRVPTEGYPRAPPAS